MKNVNISWGHALTCALEYPKDDREAAYRANTKMLQLMEDGWVMLETFHLSKSNFRAVLAKVDSANAQCDSQIPVKKL
jgi:hypothetical protein